MSSSSEAIRRAVRKALREMRASQQLTDHLPLSVPTWGEDELIEAIDCLLGGRLTMGARVRSFERKFARYVGASDGVMVNSGSSANLLAMFLISNPEVEGHLSLGDEVITPAMTWSTTVFSILAAGLVPVFVDVDPLTLTIDTDEVAKAISDRTKAIFCVHLLGNPCDMRPLRALSERHHLWLIEDACEAHGAKAEGGDLVGSIGDLGTFSFFFSHHITTIEGGIVLSSRQHHIDTLRSLRAHGWIRERSDREKIWDAHPSLDPRFLFANLGFNLRPTEIQGAFGVHQIERLEGIISDRRRLARSLSERLEIYEDLLQLPVERPGTRNVYFAYPIVVRENAHFTAKELASHLEQKGIETRPIMSGNMTTHPALRMFTFKRVGSLDEADRISKGGIMFGLHRGYGDLWADRIVEVISNFMVKHGGER